MYQNTDERHSREAEGLMSGSDFMFSEYVVRLGVVRSLHGLLLSCMGGLQP